MKSETFVLYSFKGIGGPNPDNYRLPTEYLTVFEKEEDRKPLYDSLRDAGWDHTQTMLLEYKSDKGDSDALKEVKGIIKADDAENVFAVLSANRRAFAIQQGLKSTTLWTAPAFAPELPVEARPYGWDSKAKTEGERFAEVIADKGLKVEIFVGLTDEQREELRRKDQRTAVTTRKLQGASLFRLIQRELGLGHTREKIMANLGVSGNDVQWTQLLEKMPKIGWDSVIKAHHLAVFGKRKLGSKAQQAMEAIKVVDVPAIKTGAESRKLLSAAYQRDDLAYEIARDVKGVENIEEAIKAELERREKVERAKLKAKVGKVQGSGANQKVYAKADLAEDEKEVTVWWHDLGNLVRFYAENPPTFMDKGLVKEGIDPYYGGKDFQEAFAKCRVDYVAPKEEEAPAVTRVADKVIIEQANERGVPDTVRDLMLAKDETKLKAAKLELSRSLDFRDRVKQAIVGKADTDMLSVAEIKELLTLSGS